MVVTIMEAINKIRVARILRTPDETRTHPAVFAEAAGYRSFKWGTI
jgi:hypothetical protein